MTLKEANTTHFSGFKKTELKWSEYVILDVLSASMFICNKTENENNLNSINIKEFFRNSTRHQI
jgi:hypothetical protein